MPGTWEITTNHWYYSRTSPFPVAHIGNRHILLEKNGLSNSRRCLKILSSEEIGQFYICIHLCRTSDHCNRIRLTPHHQEQQWIILQFQGIPAVPAMIQHHTPNQQPSPSYGFVDRMVRVAKKLKDKAGREGKLWISGLYEYRVTPQFGSIASPLQLITQCTPREKDLPQLSST